MRLCWLRDERVMRASCQLVSVRTPTAAAMPGSTLQQLAVSQLLRVRRARRAPASPCSALLTGCLPLLLLCSAAATHRGGSSLTGTARASRVCRMMRSRKGVPMGVSAMVKVSWSRVGSVQRDWLQRAMLSSCESNQMPSRGT